MKIGAHNLGPVEVVEELELGTGDRPFVKKIPPNPSLVNDPGYFFEHSYVTTPADGKRKLVVDKVTVTQNPNDPNVMDVVVDITCPLDYVYVDFVLKHDSLLKDPITITLR